MKFFNIDLHASVIHDITNIFNNFGHTVDDWSLSGHAWVMNKNKTKIVLNDGSELNSGGTCTEELCDKFYETFKNKLCDYDGFIACYPVEFAMLYEKWNKPIIIVNCIRYEHPNIKYPIIHEKLNIFLKKWNEKKLLWFICNNKGDKWYTEYFTGICGIHIPSLCDYTFEKYSGTSNKFIIHNRSHVEKINKNCISLGALCVNHKYSWKELYSQKGIIHVPYHNGSMSIFEHYTANVPMFMPSKIFIEKLFHENKALDDLTFCKIYKMEEPLDENNPLSLRNPIILKKWIDSCDFYDEENMPYVQLFDDWDHLNYLLDNVDLKKISNDMSEFNIIRKKNIYNSWSIILNEIKNI